MTSGAIQVITALSCAILIIGFLMYLKRNFQKKVIGALLCEFITPEGNGYERLYPVEHGVVELPLKEVQKGKKKGKTFLVDKLATFIVDYPENFPAFLQAKAKKAVFFEGSFIPVSIPKGKVSNMYSPEFLYNLKNEMFSELAVAYSRDEKSLLEKLEKQPKPSTLYLWMAIITLAVLGLGFYLYMNLPEMLEILKALGAGAGVL